MPSAGVALNRILFNNQLSPLVDDNFSRFSGLKVDKTTNSYRKFLSFLYQI